MRLGAFNFHKLTEKVMLLKLFATRSLLALMLGLGAMSSVYAQNQSPQQMPSMQPEAMNPADVSDQHLEKFANVNVKAQEIQEKYKSEVDGAKTLDDIETIQEKMNGELVDAIESEDLSVQKYQQVGMAVQQDPELRQRAIEKITEKSNSRP
ncbi:MAG: DUF4168 domain-containing protein [Gammaproteobacteria bacterium]|nr:DUF4168 domain-containing protein [Gammaproteobacteria bacterium]